MRVRGSCHVPFSTRLDQLSVYKDRLLHWQNPSDLGFGAAPMKISIQRNFITECKDCFPKLDGCIRRTYRLRASRILSFIFRNVESVWNWSQGARRQGRPPPQQALPQCQRMQLPSRQIKTPGGVPKNPPWGQLPRFPEQLGEQSAVGCWH